MTAADPPKRRRWLVLTGTVVVVLAGLLAAVSARWPDEPSRVVYEVTGDAASATVTYSTFTETGTTHEVLTTFPWRKELVVHEEITGGVLTVRVGEGGGSVACGISVDGVERKSATATGPLASALCSGFADGGLRGTWFPVGGLLV
ncbi:MmpS family transport accessory protein [Actinosynnema sp. NPDC020468]|uniref:MmpS family transport accessory protein n=1 Tax=Actinosynnema sp. NPDC020468 TaxID=3154488 RepID=UPI0033C20BF5